MPADLRLRPSSSRSTRPFLTPFRLAFLLTLLLTITYFSLSYNLPPYSWYQTLKHRHDKVVLHRPGFKHVERYSKEHRYRPAVSPVLKTVGKDGKVVLKGQYH